jgi:hypothetical protein
MKNRLKLSCIAFLSAVSILTFSGCKKDYLEENDVFAQDGFIKGKIVGTRETDNQPFEINFDYTAINAEFTDQQVNTSGDKSFLEQYVWRRFEKGQNRGGNTMAISLNFKNATDIEPTILEIDGRFTASAQNGKVFIYEFTMNTNEIATSNTNKQIIRFSDIVADTKMNRVKGSFTINLPTGNDFANSNDNATIITGSFDLPFNSELR